MTFSDKIVLRGHIIDSLILPRVFDAVMDMGGDFDVEEIHVGKHKDDPSFARLRILGETEMQLEQILQKLTDYGAEILSSKDASVKPAPRDGALPPDFYSTTNLLTDVRLAGEWVPVSGIEMDVAIVVDQEAGTARALPMLFVKEGDPIVVGHEGVRVHPLERSRDAGLSFSFMNSDVSSEKPKKIGDLPDRP